MKKLLTALALPLLAGAAQADDMRVLVQDYVMTEVTAWAFDPILIEAIRAQNEKYASISEGEIGELDSNWQNEVGGSDTPLISAVIDNPVADFLRKKKADSEGAISEAFVMDAVGLNVAASDITSDYWQGDEAKYKMTYAVGPDAVFVDEVEFDESSQAYQSQASLTIVDPSTGESIGVLTVGIDVEALM